MVNLKEWAEREGVHHVTAYRWFREGKLPVPARRVGRLILVDPAVTIARCTEMTAVCAGVVGWSEDRSGPAGRPSDRMGYREGPRR